MTPDAYMRRRTRAEFASDVQGWATSLFYPINQVAKSFVGDGSDAPPPSPQIENQSRPNVSADPTQIERERRARRIYGWKRKVAGRRYSLVNLDVADQRAYRENVSTMKSSFMKANS